MTEETADWDWRWPETPASEPEILPSDDPDQSGRPITKIQSPYDRDKPAMCYPATPLAEGVTELVEKLHPRQINAIGTHTHGKMKNGVWVPPPGEGGFDGLGDAERRAIWMIASVLGGGPVRTEGGHPPLAPVGGSFCSGGTEANLEGLWVGRQYLRQYPDPMRRGIVVLVTPLTHYSVHKAVDILDMGRCQTTTCSICGEDHIYLGDRSGAGVAYVAMNARGEMDVDDLARVVQSKYADGFRRFLVVPTVGTTVLGSVDPIHKIDAVVSELEHELNVNFYVHVDASFGGFTAPFLNPGFPIGFENAHVMSMAVDADKMGHLPYPAGVFLCRKGLQGLIGRKVGYVRGHHDDTVSGSRSGVTPLVAYATYRRLGVSGQRAFVQQCVDARDTLASRLQELADQDQQRCGKRRLVIGPVPQWTNFLPIQVRVDERGAIPKVFLEGEGQLAPYELRSDFVPRDPSDVRSCPDTVYKLCIMPHHTPERLDRFVEDLSIVLKGASR